MVFALKLDEISYFLSVSCEFSTFSIFSPYKFPQARYEDRSPYDNNRYNPYENFRYGERHNNDYPKYGENYDFDRNRNPYNDYNRPTNFNDDRNRDPNYNRYGSNYDDRNRDPNYNRYGENNNYDDRNRDQFYTNRNPYDDRNRYTNEDYEKYRLDLERQNRVEDANLARLLDDIDELASQECNINVGSQWNFETNVNEQTQQESVS